MAPFRLLCLVGLGGLIEADLMHSGHLVSWAILFAAGGLGWSWATVITAAAATRDRVRSWVTGRPVHRSPQDPAVLAAELHALQAQLAQLRETATSYDLSLDESLHRIDERLRNMERGNQSSQTIRRMG
jgi:hypothetical protein